MSLHSRLLGLLSAIAYGLQRAQIGFLRLRAVAVLVCLSLAVYALLSGWRTPLMPAHLGASFLCLAIAFLLVWLDRRRYAVFQPTPRRAETQPRSLRPEEKLFLRGTGTFEVGNMSYYLVEVPVVFWTTEMGDHILAAKVQPANVLGIGVPREQRGWWYIFVEPPRVVKLETGVLYFGLNSRPAVRLVYRSPKGSETIYLSCDRGEQLAQLVGEIQPVPAAQRQT